MTSTDYGSNPYGVTASNPYYASPLKPPPPPRILRNNRPSILVGVVLHVLILGNISTWVIFIHGTQSNANTAFATATSISNTNETLLYSADWSHGLNGWTGTSDWTVLNGMLHNDGTDDRLAQVHFDDGNTWHTFRFEAKGTRLSYLIDGELIVGLNDSRYSSGGQLGFKSAGTQLNISSFKVFSL